MLSHQFLAESANTVVAYLKPVYTLCFSTKEPVIEKKPRKHRARTSFKTNKTASLELPTTVQQIEKCEPLPEKKEDVPASSAYLITTLFGALSSYFVKPAKPPLVEVKTCEVSKKIISIEMKKLENKRKFIKDPEALKNISYEKIKLVEEQIKEHAARRVDLFFYLVLAVYGKHVLVTKGATVGQHGRGSKLKGTQACHSSLFPAVTLEPIKTAWSWLISSLPPSLENTHLKDVLNMTVELPHAVNVFDKCMESKEQVNECLAILNKASTSEIDPREAMNQFLKVMEQFFAYYKKKYLASTKDNSEANQLIWDAQYAGTFRVANKDFTLNEDYLYLMLRLKPAEIASVKKTPKACQAFYQRVQDEIFAVVDEKKSITSMKQKR